MTDHAQIFLIARPVDDIDTAADLLTAACAGGDVAAVLLPFAMDDERARIKALKALAPIIQATGAAVIAQAAPTVAARGGADGAHVEAGTETVGEAIEALKPERIVGVGAIHTRHDAMSAGELDVDYLLFGEPRADGSVPELDATVERTAWWAEIFAVPCIGYATELAHVEAIAATGAEFVGLGEAVWTHPAGPAAAIAEARAIITATAGQAGEQ